MQVKETQKYLPIKDFREQGFLQELNRQFLHPLGLALEVTLNDDGTEHISGVWDHRDDPEGMWYGELDEKRAAKYRDKARIVLQEREKHHIFRIDNGIGDPVQPIPGWEDIRTVPTTVDNMYTVDS